MRSNVWLTSFGCGGGASTRTAARPPGKERSLESEQARYDCWLVVAAETLGAPVPDPAPTPARPLAPETGAVLEDGLAHAGLDAFAPRPGTTGDVIGDGDLIV